jgi:hypothetical protein
MSATPLAYPALGRGQRPDGRSGTPHGDVNRGALSGKVVTITGASEIAAQGR